MRRISDIPLEELKEAVASSATFKEAIQKLGYFGQGGAYRTFRKRIEAEHIDCSHMTHYTPKATKCRDIKTIFIKGSDVSSNTLRRAVLKHTDIPYKCAICGNEGKWNGKDLSLTLDHINGNHLDNRVKNLRFVCPNCDRQLETYGSKNKVSYYKDPAVKHTEDYEPNIKYTKKAKYKCTKCGAPVWDKNSLCTSCRKEYNRRNFPTKEELLEAIKKCNSFVALGKYFNVSDNAMRNRCKYYGLPTSSVELREYRKKLINKLTED